MAEQPLRSPDAVELDALIAECELLLSACTDKQRDMFDKVFPGGLSALSRNGLHDALRLLNRTHAANRSKERSP